MGVPWEFASTTTLVVLEEATQVCDGPQSWEGGQPPQVCPQPSPPQVFPLQLEMQPTPASGALPVDPPGAPVPPEVPPDPADPPPVPPVPVLPATPLEPPPLPPLLPCPKVPAEPVGVVLPAPVRVAQPISAHSAAIAVSASFKVLSNLEWSSMVGPREPEHCTKQIESGGSIARGLTAVAPRLRLKVREALGPRTRPAGS